MKHVDPQALGLCAAYLFCMIACDGKDDLTPQREVTSKAERQRVSPPASTTVEPPTQTFPRASSRQLKSFLGVGRDALAPLRVEVGAPVVLNLALAGSTSWADVFVSDVAVRTPGRIASLNVQNGVLEHTFRFAGPSLITACTGPKAISRLSKAWELVTHCSKVLVRVGDASAFDLGIAGRTGAPLEVVPLVSPLRLRVGDELPVRFYAFGDKWKRKPVRAYHPDGTRETLETDSQGLTRVRLSQAGRWVIRLEAQRLDGERIAEFVFDLPERRTS